MLEDTYKIYDRNGTLLKDGDKLDDGSSLKSYWREWYIDCNSKDTIFPITEFILDNYKDGFKLVDFEKESTAKLKKETQTNETNETNSNAMSNSQIIKDNIGKNVIYLYYKNVYVGVISKSIDKRYVRYTDCTIEIAQFVEGTSDIDTVLGLNYDRLVIDGGKDE